MSSPSNILNSSSSTINDIYSHDPDCKYDHPIPDSNTLDHIIDSVIDSFSSSNTSITRELIEDTIRQPIHSLLMPSHKCKSPYAFHHHLSARTLFKRDYINIIHKEILTPKPKLSASPTTSNGSNISSSPSSSRSGSIKKPLTTLNTFYTSSSSSNSKTLDQEINVLASLWAEIPQEERQVYEILEKCSEKVHEYMFKANRVEKEREENARRKNMFEITSTSQTSNISNKQQNTMKTTNIEENYESEKVQKEKSN